MPDVSKLAATIGRAVVAALEPLVERLKAVEGRQQLPGPAGPAGEKGLDGANGNDGRDGVDGKDGAPGRDGRDGQPGVQGEKGLDGAHGKDGRDGIDGKDGLGFDDLSLVHDGERGFKFVFTRGEQTKEFAFSIPALIYRGVFVDGRAYVKGDVTTWGGAAWACHSDTTTKPGDGSKDWQLMVKRGAEGKPGPRGEKGMDGRNGKDGVVQQRW